MVLYYQQGLMKAIFTTTITELLTLLLVTAQTVLW